MAVTRGATCVANPLAYTLSRKSRIRLFDLVKPRGILEAGTLRVKGGYQVRHMQYAVTTRSSN